MMIDSKWVLKDTNGSEDLATSDTSAVESDYIDLKTADWKNAGRPLVLVVGVKSTTAAGGSGFTISIEDCDTSGGSYADIAVRTVPLASCTAGNIVAEIPLPYGTRQFIKAKITPVGSMTGALTCNAAFVNK